MRFGRLSAILIACAFALTVNSVYAQRNSVNVRFEVDGKEVRRKFKILVYISGKIVKSSYSKTGFTVPSGIGESDEIMVRFLSKKHDLMFDSIHPSKLGTDWVVGVDNYPFDKENVDTEETIPQGKKIARIYYIEFLSRKGLDTRLVKRVYK